MQRDGAGNRIRLTALLLAGALLASAGALAQPAPRTPTAPTPAAEARLPPDALTHHTMTLGAATLKFTATVGTIRPTDQSGKEQAQVEYVAYTLDGADPKTRPVTFVTNGGPGSGSAWMQLGALGPWRVDLGRPVRSPSAPPVVTDNPDTWLDFTDLVFVDPPGTGWSRLADDSEAIRKHVWSVDGDVQVLADMIRRWLQQGGRMESPKYFAGESYAGLRGPRLVRALATQQGVGLSGIVLISPLIDPAVRSGALDVLGFMTNLPSMAAVAHHLPVTALGPVEAYAEGEYLADLLRGQADTATVDRMSPHVADLTGLDPGLVRRHNGRVAVGLFLREHDAGAVDSIYDGTLSIPNPFPEATFPNVPDPVFAQFGPLVSSAITALVTERLNWHPEGVYELGNDRVNREWDWGDHYGRPESMSAIRTSLAADPNFHVLIAHGIYDLITPYLATKLLLSQLPNEDFVSRVKVVLHEGGHMFYTHDSSRAALHEEARALVLNQ